MTHLYDLHLSRHISGMSKGPVKSIPAKGLVFDLDAEGNAVSPDRSSVRECLPSCYHKAFDRAAMSKFSNERGSIHFTLYSSRHKYLNTVYAVPYEFTTQG